MVRPSIERPCLCFVTDGGPTTSGDAVAAVSAALEGGVRMVQLRAKQLAASRLLKLARELRSATHGRALLVVNDRLDIAMLSGADGVQLGEDGLDVASARQFVGPEMVIGRSVHSELGAIQAETEGADFLVLGTIFETRSHPGADTGGLRLVRSVASRVAIPVLGIGGITPENVGGVLESGADGAAVISAISSAPHPASAAARLTTAMRSTHSRPVG